MDWKKRGKICEQVELAEVFECMKKFTVLSAAATIHDPRYFDTNLDDFIDNLKKAQFNSKVELLEAFWLVNNGLKLFCLTALQIPSGISQPERSLLLQKFQHQTWLIDRYLALAEEFIYERRNFVTVKKMLHISKLYCRCCVDIDNGVFYYLHYG